MARQSKRTGLGTSSVNSDLSETPILGDNNDGIWVRNVLDAIVVAVGESGTEYRFAPRAAVKVAAMDVEGLLRKRLGYTGCCGGNPGGNVMLERV